MSVTLKACPCYDVIIVFYISALALMDTLVTYTQQYIVGDWSELTASHRTLTWLLVR